MKSLDARLRNWGAWSRSPLTAPRVSPLYVIMQEHAPQPAMPEPGDIPRALIDEADARIMEAAIIRAHLLPFELRILRDRYIGQMENRQICVKERLRFRRFDVHLAAIFRKLLHILEN